jgi:redox-sensitive bicupin YhaK (pirin superfamily)
MNEDWVAPGQGFGTHPHRNMEIVTYVLEGALEHKDSMGNGEILKPGEFQRMTAGTGITHSEFNPSLTDPVHLYQIWLFPDQQGLEPSYEQKSFSESERHNQFRLVASKDGESRSLLIHQDARIFLSNIERGEELKFDFKPGRHGWLQVFRGAIEVNDEAAVAGDGIAVSDVLQIAVRASEDAEIMLFDLA